MKRRPLIREAPVSDILAFRREDYQGLPATYEYPFTTTDAPAARGWLT